MAELKTKKNEASVDAFLNKIPEEKRRKDCFTIMQLMKKVTKSEPKMWGDSIVGFGTYHYKYESGREGDWFPVGFSPRKQNLSLYLMCDMEKRSGLLKKLGKYKMAKSCIYIKKIEDIDLSVLTELIAQAIKFHAKNAT